MKRKFLVIAGLLFAGLLFAPKISKAATVYLSPSSGSYNVGATITVSVRVNSQNAAVNTAESNITYSTDTLSLVSVKQGSTFYLASPGSPGKGANNAYFAGGLPSPGYNGSSGSLGTLTFRAKAVGSATVSVGGSHVLLNDGNGTDAFSGGSGAKFTINAAPPPSVGAPAVSSTTHPSSDAWYNATTAELSWNRPNGTYGYSFEFDQEPDTTPDSTLDTTVTTTKSFPDLKDGVYYFHIRGRAQDSAAGFSATTHFKIQIDTKAPNPFEVKLEDAADPKNLTSQPTITFATTDEGSGIDHYNIAVDGQSVEDHESPYTFTTIESGEHKITVTAFDRAGNKTAASTLTVTLAEAAAPKKGLLSQGVPLWWLLILAIFFLILFILFWFILGKRRKRRPSESEELAAIQAEVDESLDKLEDIEKRLSKFARRVKKSKSLDDED